MKHKQLMIEFAVILGAFVLYGIIKNSNIFKVDIGGWMALMGISWIVGTIFFTLAFSPIDHSIRAIVLGLLLLVLGAILHNPTPSPYVSYNEKNGIHASSKWELTITYKNNGLSENSKFDFTGTFDESEIALREIVNEWNRTHPSNPVIKSDKTPYDFPAL